jgi:hypothetical protein
MVLISGTVFDIRSITWGLFTAGRAIMQNQWKIMKKRLPVLLKWAMNFRHPIASTTLATFTSIRETPNAPSTI